MEINLFLLVPLDMAYYIFNDKNNFIINTTN